jgi:hypothetical protein
VLDEIAEQVQHAALDGHLHAFANELAALRIELEAVENQPHPAGVVLPNPS